MRACGARPSRGAGPSGDRLAGPCPGEANGVIAGVRSPPLRGRQAQDAWPNGENREITRKAVFSEGRGLRARKKRGGRMPGYGMMIGGKRTPGGQENTCPGQAQAFLTGVRSPPLRGEASRATMALRGRAGIARKGVFSVGCALRVPRDRPPRMPIHAFSVIKSLALQREPYFFSTRRAALGYI
jgi:hypothetical protein